MKRKLKRDKKNVERRRRYREAKKLLEEFLEQAKPRRTASWDRPDHEGWE